MLKFLSEKRKSDGRKVYQERAPRAKPRRNPVAIILNIVVWVFTEIPVLVGITGVLSLFGLYKFYTWYLQRDIAREMKQELIENASKLDPYFRPSAAHLMRRKDDYSGGDS